MPLVFINYRGSDQPWVATALCGALATRLSSDEVFLDTRIPVGEDYAPLLLSTVRSSAALLVVIGPDWYSAGPSGRLIDNRDDWVRREIAEAFTAGVRVIPLLVDETAELVRDDLPPDIRRLAGLQHLRVRSRDAERDIQRVIDEVDDIVAIEPRLASGGRSATREDIDRWLRKILPSVQQRLGNRGLLVDVAWALLRADERPRFLAPCRFSGRTAGSAILLTTDRRICIADPDHENRIRQVLRFSLNHITGTEMHRRRRAGVVPTADLVFHTSDGNRVLVKGLLRAQAEKMVEIVAIPPVGR